MASKRVNSISVQQRGVPAQAAPARTQAAAAGKSARNQGSGKAGGKQAPTEQHSATGKRKKETRLLVENAQIEEDNDETYDVNGEPLALPWLYLNEEQIKEIENAASDEIAINHLAKFLGDMDWKNDLLQNCLVNYYFNIFSCAKSRKMKTVQIGTFFSLMRLGLTYGAEKSLPLEKAMIDFKKQLLLYTAGTKPPAEPSADLYRGTVFEPAQAKFVMDYASETLFQHYHLYKFALQHVQEPETISFTLTLDEPPQFQAMCEAITEEQYAEELLQREKERLEEEKQEMVRRIAQNPFQWLSIERVHRVTLETVQSVFIQLQTEMDQLLQQQQEKFTPVFQALESQSTK